MKTVKTAFPIPIVLLLIGTGCFSQTLNWASLQSNQRHIVNLNVRYDYAFAYGIGYGYHLKTGLPIVLTLDHSQPVGEEVFDDFKTKVGGQIRLYQVKNFQFTARVQGVFRRFENDYVRLLNFGSDLAAVAGYYKPKWFAAGEFGFDKAIVTHFKHSGEFRENYPNVKDGWYQPATGGNFYYGILTGLSFNRNDVTAKIGKVIEQDFRTTSPVPFYFQLGFSRRF